MCNCDCNSKENAVAHRVSKGSFTRCVFLFTFAMWKLDCVDLNDTGHMVRFALFMQYSVVCDVAYEWVPYLFCAIVMCDSSLYDVHSNSYT